MEQFKFDLALFTDRPRSPKLFAGVVNDMNYAGIECHSSRCQVEAPQIQD